MKIILVVVIGSNLLMSSLHLLRFIFHARHHKIVANSIFAYVVKVSYFFLFFSFACVVPHSLNLPYQSIISILFTHDNQCITSPGPLYGSGTTGTAQTDGLFERQK